MDEPFPQRKWLVHIAPPWVKSGRSLFRHDLLRPTRKSNSLAQLEVFQIFARATEYYVAAEKLWASLLLAMPDHVHALLAFPVEHRMEKVIRDWKRFTAKTAGIQWQDGFFDHRLHHDESFEEKARYVRMNPVRAGLVSTPEEWPYVWPGRAGYP